MKKPVDSDQPIQIAILGAGRGGTALIHLFTRSPGVKIIGIADIDPGAQGLQCAREFDIPTTHDPISLITRKETELVVDVTGDPAMGPLIERCKHPGVEVLGGTSARLLWNLVRHESQIQDQLLQAEKLATIGTLSSGIAHDINNRLYLIMSLAENMADGLEPDSVIEHAGQILKAVRRIRTIVQGLTGYARAPSNQLEVVDLAACLEEALRMAQYATVFHDIAVERIFTGEALVRANPQELLQVFVNLIINSVQAMDGKGTVRLESGRENGAVYATVSDSGPGIPEELLDRIFEPFFTTKEAGKGTGLGLHMVQTIVNKYDGKIRIQNRDGKGVSFRLQFPAVRELEARAAGGVRSMRENGG